MERRIRLIFVERDMGDEADEPGEMSMGDALAEREEMDMGDAGGVCGEIAIGDELRERDERDMGDALWDLLNVRESGDFVFGI